MRPVSVMYDGILAEVSGGWVVSTDDDGEVSIRLDDGQRAMCLPDDRIAAGDRIYRATYTGHELRRGVGVEIYDVTAGVTQSSCRIRKRSVGMAYVAVAAVPMFILAGLLVAMAVVGPDVVVPSILAGVIAAVVVPALVWMVHALIDARRSREDRGRVAGCRRTIRRLVDQDVAVWKERLLDAVPAATARGTVIRGTACRIVEGLSSIGGARSEIIRAGRFVPLGDEAIRECLLEDGDLVHALVPAGRLSSEPIAVSNPLTGRVWLDGSVAGGRDGVPHADAMRTALGRAAWGMVTRQWDEIGRRRGIARSA